MISTAIEKMSSITFSNSITLDRLRKQNRLSLSLLGYFQKLGHSFSA